MTLVALVAELDLQSIATLAIVAAAIAGLARRAYALFASEQVKGCASGCSGCPATHGRTPALVPLQIHAPDVTGRAARAR